MHQSEAEKTQFRLLKVSSPSLMSRSVGGNGMEWKKTKKSSPLSWLLCSSCVLNLWPKEITMNYFVIYTQDEFLMKIRNKTFLWLLDFNGLFGRRPFVYSSSTNGRVNNNWLQCFLPVLRPSFDYINLNFYSFLIELYFVPLKLVFCFSCSPFRTKDK